MLNNFRCSVVRQSLLSVPKSPIRSCLIRTMTSKTGQSRIGEHGRLLLSWSTIARNADAVEGLMTRFWRPLKTDQIVERSRTSRGGVAVRGRQACNGRVGDGAGIAKRP